MRAQVAFNEYYLESRVAFNEAPCPRLSVPRWCSFPVCCTYYVTLTGHTRTPGTGLGDPGPLIGQILSSPASHWSGPGVIVEADGASGQAGSLGDFFKIYNECDNVLIASRNI